MTKEAGWENAIDYVITVKYPVNNFEREIFLTTALPVYGENGFHIISRCIIQCMLPEASENDDPILELTYETQEDWRDRKLVEKGVKK